MPEKCPNDHPVLGTFLKQKTSISINKDDKIKRDLVLLQLKFFLPTVKDTNEKVQYVLLLVKVAFLSHPSQLRYDFPLINPLTKYTTLIVVVLWIFCCDTTPKRSWGFLSILELPFSAGGRYVALV